MKRENPPPSGAIRRGPSRGLILDGTSVWKKRPKHASGAASLQHWSRYIDSRLKQFSSR